jgi:hypothetical protein
MLASVLNSAWFASNLPAYWNLKRSFADPLACQQRVLQRILDSNAYTVFGRRYRFSGMRDAIEYQCKVPVHCYDDLTSMIEDIRKGKTNVLTREPVTHLMPSSGSTTARKLIPYTRSLQREFDRAIAAWMVDLYCRHPGLVAGRAYWSITPYHDETGQDGGLPIGFSQDSSYLGGYKQRLVESLMAVREGLTKIHDVESFRYVTLLELLRCSDLRLISVWHPSFLTLLMEELDGLWDFLLRDINDGTITTPNRLQPSIRDSFDAKPDRNRRLQLDRANSIDGGSIWPCLDVISCWGSGHAQGAISELNRYFPGVVFQQKGLIATEAFMSLPFGKDESGNWLHPLAINSHFFEFIDDEGSVKQVDEIRLDQEYQIVVTTGGGLYRYAMNDRIRVDGYIGRTPSIEFIGKADSVTDFYGEKLNDRFVASIIESLVASLSGSVPFAMLAPDGADKPEYYTLYMESDAPPDNAIGDRLEEKLCANPHYAVCRRLGQLKKAKIFRVSHSANKQYLLSSAADGRRLGDIKPVKLSNRRGWSETFSGGYLA